MTNIRRDRANDLQLIGGFEAEGTGETMRWRLAAARTRHEIFVTIGAG
jgi:hypothetical protein